MANQGLSNQVRERTYVDLGSSFDASDFFDNQTRVITFVFKVGDGKPALTEAVAQSARPVTSRRRTPTNEIGSATSNLIYKTFTPRLGADTDALGRDVIEAEAVELEREGIPPRIKEAKPPSARERAALNNEQRSARQDRRGAAPDARRPSEPISSSNDMNSPTREEIDSKLEAIEARLETRVTEVSGKIDTLMTKLDERDRLYQNQFTTINSKLDAVSNLKNTVIGTGVGVVGLTFAAMAVVGAGFDSGRETAQLTASAERSAAAAQQASAAANQAAGMARFMQDPRSVEKPAENDEQAQPAKR